MKLFINKLKGIWISFSKLSLPLKMFLGILLIALIWFGWSKLNTNNKNGISYQTQKAEKGTLVVTVSGSGQVASVNSVQVTTQASGVVNKVYVKDGDMVKTGDPIIGLELDLVGKQRYQQALASYQGAKNSLETSKANLYTSQSEMLDKWDTFIDLATNPDYEYDNGTPNVQNRERVDFMTTNNDWLAAEAKYKIQQAAITQAQTSLSSSWSSLQQSSPIIYAPITGRISGMSLQEGNVISSSTSTSGSATSVKIANVETEGLPSITVNMSEIDVPKIKIGDKATVNLDALTDKTFTGKVVSIDTVGSISSGVTVYPAVVRLDTKVSEILPNMSASANIITAVKDDVILAPNSSIVNQNGEQKIRIMQSGKPTEVAVETGLASDAMTEILSGLSEGDTLITNIIQSTSATTNSSSSPFGMFGSGRSTNQMMRVPR